MSSSSSSFDEWFRVLCEQLANQDVDERLAFEFARTASEMTDFDPFNVNWSSLSPPSPSKRRRSLPSDANSGSACASTNPPSCMTENPYEGGDNGMSNASEFVDWQVEKKLWKKVTARSVRKNTGNFSHLPPTEHEYEFIVDGFQKSTFNLKDTIKAAGYTHFSANSYGGWTPFTLPGNVKGFGRPVQ